MIPIWIIAALGITAAVAVTFWPQILNWARNSLLPWVRKNIPEIADFVEKGLIALDNLVVSVRSMVKSAWKKLRKYLLRSFIEFIFDGEWKRKTESWIEDNEGVNHITTTEKVAHEDVPPEVRQHIIKKRNTYKKDMTEIRDKEIQEMQMS